MASDHKKRMKQIKNQVVESFEQSRDNGVWDPLLIDLNPIAEYIAEACPNVHVEWGYSTGQPLLTVATERFGNSLSITFRFLTLAHTVYGYTFETKKNEMIVSWNSTSERLYPSKWMIKMGLHRLFRKAMKVQRFYEDQVDNPLQS